MATSPRSNSHDGLVVDNDDGEALRSPLLQMAWQVVWLNRLTVAGIVTASLVIALVANLLATPQFTSTARLQVNRVEANVSDVEGVEPEGQVLDYDEFYQTQYALLRSSSLAERVARSLSLAADEEFLEAFDLAADGGIADASSRRAVEQIGEVLLEQVSIKPVTGSSLVD